MSRKPLLLAALPAVLAAALIGGCSPSDDRQPTPTAELTSAAPSEQPGPSQPPSTEPAAEETSETTEGNLDVALTAARLAMDQVATSTVTGIDLGRGNTLWRIELIGPEGKEYDLGISADGTEIVDPLVEDSTSDKDRAANTALTDRIVVDFEQALQIAGDRFEDAVLDEIDLDLDNDVLRWEVELNDAQGVSNEFDIDAVTGEVSNQR